MQQAVGAKDDLRVERGEEPPPSRLFLPFIEALAHPVFRLVWLTGLFANLGDWAQSVAAAWELTVTEASPFLIALIQVATAVPLVLLSLPTGALADIYDRRKMILAGEACCVAGGLGLTLLGFLGLLEPIGLIGLTFLIAVGYALEGPAWQAAVGDMVPKPAVASAVLLNSINYNVARALGPAIGGFLLAWLGASWVFLISTASFGGLLAAIWSWKWRPARSALPPETLRQAVTAGLRFARHSLVTRRVATRSFIFGFCASSVWALLPLLALEQLGEDAIGYGVLLGALGVGAVCGGFVVHPAREWLGTSWLISTSAFAFAAVLLVLGTVHLTVVVVPVLFLGGVAWIAVVSTYNTAVQLLVPDWVKARAMAIYQMALYGGLALGSVVWGAVAESAGVTMTLAASGVALLVGALWALRLKIPDIALIDLRPAPLRKVDLPAPPIDPRRDAVMVVVEYRIGPEQERDFIRSSARLREVRLRNGASRWSLFRDAADRLKWSEIYFVDSWYEHLRLLARLTAADRELIDRVGRLHQGPPPPAVRHAISWRRRRRRMTAAPPPVAKLSANDAAKPEAEAGRAPPERAPSAS
ncbi:MFS transporter [Inquilinus limosus]|uniref:MFS transporter n=1 Tax=Inquilinus limosus TaxID=171674 RepID=UPI0006900C63|nr:MFS transporter [Inquilinus limosus]